MTWTYAAWAVCLTYGSLMALLTVTIIADRLIERRVARMAQRAEADHAVWAAADPAVTEWERAVAEAMAVAEPKEGRA